MVIASDIVDVGYMPFERSPETAIKSDLRKPPSSTENQLQSLKRKIGRYAQYLRNFDRPLGLPLVISGDVFENRQHVISLKTTARVHGNCCCIQLWSISRHHLYFAILQNIHNFACSFRRLFCITPFRILHNTNTHHQTGQQ